MTNHTFRSLTLFAALVFFALTMQAQQLKTPAPSPQQTIKQAFALSDITIEYSRPSAKGRIIYGDLVPFGKIWRTGANAATKITLGDTLKIEGKTIPAGTYAMYTIPGKDNWEILFYKDLSLGGEVSEYKIENELFRVSVKPGALVNKVETFTISIADITPTSANIELMWEQTRVAFKVTVETDARIMKNIETTMSKDSRPYYQAANYYYENGKDLNKALEWVNKAIELNPKAYYIVHVKAKIQAKMNDKNAAIATAEESMRLALDEKSDDYVRLNQKLIADLKK